MLASSAQIGGSTSLTGVKRRKSWVTGGKEWQGGVCLARDLNGCRFKWAPQKCSSASRSGSAKSGHGRRKEWPPSLIGIKRRKSWVTGGKEWKGGVCQARDLNGGSFKWPPKKCSSASRSGSAKSGRGWRKEWPSF